VGLWPGIAWRVTLAFGVTSTGEVQQGPVASVSLVFGWQVSSDYLFGIDLFNHGFYREAHETWEHCGTLSGFMFRRNSNLGRRSSAFADSLAPG